ncbi:MAG: glycerophosphodiester phosphodiesterase family protein, partial [bacterium]|nr:glycerophosphodiester phosphodiesterase family protein [bacterium]
MKLLKKILMGFCLVIGLILIIIAIQYVWHGNPKSVSNKLKKTIVAHRGLHINYRKGTYDPRTGCEAEHIYPPSHDYIGNTIRSIKAAYGFGADIVEIDIRKTSDNDLVIFHDYMLDCRTDGTGLVAGHDVSYLKKLDIGYGYTADNGKFFPFRGKGIGLMPTL